MAPASKLESQNVDHYRYYPSLILGKGNFATVYLARHKVVKCDVALKIINTDDIKEDYVHRNLHREQEIMRSLQHPNIIQLYEVVKEGSLYCLSLELIRGVNLYQYMANQLYHNIPEKLARFFFYQMLSAVEYMHNINVIHRDLKLENILIEYGHIIKIADFGLSNIYYPCVELRTHCGSVEYAAPELFMSSAYGTAADVWSLGVVLYVMVVGYMPFPFHQKKLEKALHTRMRHIFTQRISRGLTLENWELMIHLSKDCRELLNRMLHPDQFRRIRIMDIKSHSWIMRDKYLIKRLPQKRNDLQRKFHPEVIEYLAYKLKASKYRIENHLNSYENDTVAAMYFMVRNTLVKEVLHPFKESENSFLYRFDCWRKNRSRANPIQEYAYGDGPRENIKNLTKENTLDFVRDVTTDNNDCKMPNQSYEEKVTGNNKKQTYSEINSRVSTDPATKYSVKKTQQCTSEEADNNSRNVQKQETNTPRTLYRSYRQSRPENVNCCKNKHAEIVKSNKCLNEVEETLPNSQIRKNSNTDKEELEKSDGDQNYHRHRMNRDMPNERNLPTRCYREHATMASEAEEYKTKYTNTNTRTLVNKTSNETRRRYPAKFEAIPEYSSNETPIKKNVNEYVGKIEILKRTEKDVNVLETMPKVADKNNIGLQAPTRQPTYNLKKNNQIDKSINPQTPNKICEKIKTTTFAQPLPPSSKEKKMSGPTRVKLYRGDIREDLK